MSSQTTSPDRVFYYRLQALLVDGASLVLRKVIDEKKTHDPLKTCLRTYKSQMSGALNKQQRYIFDPSSNPTLDDFDMSLLVCLLRYVCGLRSNRDPVWSTVPPNAIDTSTEADICRLRHARNQLAHIECATAFSQNEFETTWLGIEQVLVRLNTGIQHGVPNLTRTLSGIKSDPLDPQREDRHRLAIENWIEADKAMANTVEMLKQKLEEQGPVLRNITTNTQETNERMQTIERKLNDLEIQGDNPKLTGEEKNIHDLSQTFFEDANTKCKMYVKTSVYYEAQDKLQKSGLVILDGHPGEGKTTMATYLLLEASPVHRLLRLNKPSDWRLFNPDKYNAILIDDIFGYGIFDEQLMGQWEPWLQEIALATGRKKLSVIITTRHYILKEAKKKICRLNLFQEDTITTLSSSKLSPNEKQKILTKHLEKNGRQIDTKGVDQYWKCDTGTEMLGYPECVAMFASTEILFSKGVVFFSSPLEFFRKCLTDLSKNENEFMALVIVWARASKKVSMEDLERKNISRLHSIGEAFGYEIENNLKALKKYLDCHKDEFLIFNSKSGEYSFSHHVVDDVVGLVAAETDPKAVVMCGSKDFILKYVTTDNEKRYGEVNVCLEEFLFHTLIDKLCQLLYPNEDDERNRTKHYDLRLKEDGIENTKICRGKTTDISVVKHEAFRNRTFIQQFVTEVKSYCEKIQLIGTPFIEVFELFRSKYRIVFEPGAMRMCLPSLLLAKKNPLLVDECLSQSVLSDEEKYISLLLATRDGDRNLVQKLIDQETTITDDAIQIAVVNPDVYLLQLLLERRSSCESHIQNGNSPLMTACKKGRLEVVSCLLKGGADVNYRNQGKVSALDKALYGKHTDICRELLSHGALVNEKGGKFDRSPFHTAADMGLTDIVKHMLEHGAEVGIPDHRGENPVHSAALQGHTDVLRLLLVKDSSKANRKLSTHGRKNLKDMTLYHYAIQREDKDLVQILKEFKVDPNLQDKFGRTPLYVAAFYGKKVYVDLLLDIADAEKPEKNGYTPLHAAVYKKHMDVVILLGKTVNANISDKKGYTPLHSACKVADFDVIAALLRESNAEVRMRTKKGETVLHLLLNAYRKNTRDQMQPRTMAKCIRAIFDRDPNFRTMLEYMERREDIVPLLNEISELE